MPTATSGHREAPYSSNLKVDGVQYTIRATTEDELVTKVQSLRQRLGANASAETNGYADVKHCTLHDVVMPARIGKKSGKKYYGHRHVDSMCFGDN